jgi:hypothetical protein
MVSRGHVSVSFHLDAELDPVRRSEEMHRRSCSGYACCVADARRRVARA